MHVHMYRNLSIRHPPYSSAAPFSEPYYYSPRAIRVAKLGKGLGWPAPEGSQSADSLDQQCGVRAGSKSGYRMNLNVVMGIDSPRVVAG